MVDRKTLVDDLNNMEEVLTRTADRTDIWQDRLVHAIGKAVYHLLEREIRKMDKEAANNE